MWKIDNSEIYSFQKTFSYVILCLKFNVLLFSLITLNYYALYITEVGIFLEKHLEVLNHLLVETFNEILKIEEQSLRLVAGSEVTVNEVHTLDAIGKSEPCTVSELASAMMVTVSTMTITINRLEKKGLVKRERSGDDRRVVRVYLTDKGRSLSYVHRRFHRRMVKAVSEQLTIDEIGVLSKAMENLKDFFRQENMRNTKNIAEPEET